MGKLNKTVATLRFFGDELDPDELTRLLGSVPTTGVRKGGVWLTTNGTEKIAKSGSWRLESTDQSPGDLDTQVAELLGNLTSDVTVWTDLSERYRADIFCGLFMEDSNEGISLKPSTLTAVGERGLILDLDIYSAPIED